MKLRPCPFCAGVTIRTIEARKDPIDRGPSYVYGYRCYCEPCAAMGPSAGTAELAETAWNIRTDQLDLLKHLSHAPRGGK
jgi:hypothetical protein